ncbi:MAG: thioredoxin family protein [Chromatiaceae bacterium]|nr:thioredoxin family protein [Chromatiaceae bacterium]MCP5421585.1 thioredoxin family protein [Chromatiaceae bacterium]
MRRLLPALLLLSCFGISTLHADTVARTSQVTLTLLAEPAGYTPGRPLWLALRFDLIPQWHVYWRNPGDSGEAPRVAWQLPGGWRGGELQWPVPQRIAVGPLLNYGYADSVMLLAEVTPAAAATGAAALHADVRWLVCREECIPQQARLDLTLSVADDGTTTDPRFDAARARLPGALGGDADYRVADGRIRLRLTGSGLTPAADAALWFAADRWGPIAPSAPQRWAIDGDRLTLDLAAGEVPPSAAEPLSGLLVVGDDASRRGYTVSARAAPADDRTRTASGDSHAATIGLALAIGLAFVGGLLLNLMPCVLPVLSIKLLSLVGRHDGHTGRHGIAYSAGVLLTFALLAALLSSLRATGAMLGWGFQLQEPVIVVALMYLMLTLGMNLSGVFGFGGGLAGVGQTAAGRPGLRGSFASGVLAVVVASPCTAPFMGTALGYALTRPVMESTLVFVALGTGFALPLLLLSLQPAWLRLLPRPGPWMERLRQALAFPLYATAAWLLWVLSQQLAAGPLAAALAGGVLLAFGLWWLGQTWRRTWSRRLPAAVLLTGGLVCAVVAATPDRGERASGGAAADAWSTGRVAQLRAAGAPVLVNFTAAWCITCKVNEQVALDTRAVVEALDAHGVAYLKADWTRRDAKITAELQRHGRSGVPLYLLYAAGDPEPRVLPQLLTERSVLDAIADIGIGKPEKTP